MINIKYDGTSFILNDPDRPNKKPINIGEGCLQNDLYRELSIIENIFFALFPGKKEYEITPEAKIRLDEILYQNQQ